MSYYDGYGTFSLPYPTREQMEEILKRTPLSDLQSIYSKLLELTCTRALARHFLLANNNARGPAREDARRRKKLEVRSLNQAKELSRAIICCLRDPQKRSSSWNVLTPIYDDNQDLTPTLAKFLSGIDLLRRLRAAEAPVLAWTTLLRAAKTYPEEWQAWGKCKGFHEVIDDLLGKILVNQMRNGQSDWIRNKKRTDELWALDQACNTHAFEENHEQSDLPKIKYPEASAYCYALRNPGQEQRDEARRQNLARTQLRHSGSIINSMGKTRSGRCFK